MYKNPPLTDAEIAKKFGITVDHPRFWFARWLSHSRPDLAICGWPEIICPHCDHTFGCFIWGWFRPGDAIVCNECERFMYVECVDLIADTITLTAEPNQCD